MEDEAKLKDRDGLKLKLLLDANLNVIRKYGVEHRKALGCSTTKFKIGSIPLFVTPSFKVMAIPTSLLIDENGIILWVWQADDYRISCNGDLVFQAI